MFDTTGLADGVVDMGRDPFKTVLDTRARERDVFLSSSPATSKMHRTSSTARGGWRCIRIAAVIDSY
jgi:hypothetical protein